MAKAAPGLLGTFSLLDERPELLEEVETYIAAEQLVERERQARERAASRRRSLRGHG